MAPKNPHRDAIGQLADGSIISFPLSELAAWQAERDRQDEVIAYAMAANSDELDLDSLDEDQLDEIIEGLDDVGDLDDLSVTRSCPT